jgi:hypothetical protein
MRYPGFRIRLGPGNPTEPATPRINDFFSLIALGERLWGVLAHDPSAFFQDANYHDQIVKEHKRTGATGAASGSHSETKQKSRNRDLLHRQPRSEKLAARGQAVKRLENQPRSRLLPVIRNRSAGVGVASTV